ncbi:unnamed protein product [Paramecium sonneborni]|uniref:Uncharacterized protein n=1 Tax=Paramecium sonneborni TaxID=65129 RepID=A0A8S1PIV0_9CILI|nr:unnamed protein product [Paramecium sonneborni]
MGRIDFYLIICEYSIVINCLFIWTLNDQQQFYALQFNRMINSFEIEECMIYGMWSRYVPLSTISQTGPVGIFDSSCYHLNSVQEKENKRINFIYYDCINIKEMNVKKIVQFISNEGKQYKFEKTLDSMKYEYYWYYFAVHLIPHKKQFTYYLLQGVTIIDIQQLQIQFPYLDENLLIVFGGGLVIEPDDILKVESENKLSFFPGQIILLSYFKGFIGNVDQQLMINLQYMFDDSCRCLENSITDLPDIDINWLEQKIFASVNKNCDAFAFQTWIKVQQVIQDQSEFMYQLIKLSSNFENPKLRDDNLSAMQIYYKISNQNSQLKFTTYNYKFPYFNLDFSDNPFLIEELFDIPIINLWHFITVLLKNDVIQIQIKYFDDRKQYRFESSHEAKQFHMVQYKLQYGNIQQLSQNYLKVSLRNQKLFNCINSDEFIFRQQCHHSCEECDGPTNTDCLSCSEISKRIYIQSHRACVCPYDTIDDYDCKDYQSFDLQISQEQGNKCNQGYFENGQICLRCPSVINENIMTCLECIQNPIDWIKDPYCQTNLFLDNNGSPSEYIKDKIKVYYVLDEKNIKPCHHYQNRKINTIDEIYEDYKLSDKNSASICSNQNYPNECQPCNLKSCVICGFLQNRQICLKCNDTSILNDGQCYEQQMGLIEQNNCLSPYYITSNKQCKLCEIENCQYCFEYKSNDLGKCTLYSQYEIFQIDEFHRIGCALCEEGFIFDFVKDKCLYQKPLIKDCLRSFINLQGQEICTLSAIDDFNIAPEIINCQKYITNCQQCYQTPLSIIKCIVCEDGYSSSITTGHCYKCRLQNAKYCIEGDYTKVDSWMQLLQSFLMQFLPNKYVYPQPTTLFYISTLAVKCIQGYQLIISDCLKYCDSNCATCSKTLKQGFQCSKCYLNYFMQPLRVKDNEKCVSCPQLCLVCQPRTQDEIQNINPYFLNNPQYFIYTQKCIKPISHPHIFVDPYIQIAKYCDNQLCQSFFQYQVENSCEGLYIAFDQFNLETLFNFRYLNEMMYQKFQLILPFQNICLGSQYHNFEIPLNNIFKSNIFSIQIVELILQGNHSPAYFHTQISFINFDSLIIKDCTFLCFKSVEFKLDNNGYPQNLIITNSEIINQENSQNIFKIISNNYQIIDFTNLKLQYLNYQDSTIFEFIPFGNQSSILINKFIIENCTFTNSVLFKFKNNPLITVQELIINNSYFLNSTIANFQYDLTITSQIQFKSIIIYNSLFQRSSIIKNVDSLTLTKLQIISNQFYFSQILVFKTNLFIEDILIQDNQLIQSQLIFKLSRTLIKSNLTIDQLNYINNSHYNSSIVSTDFSVQNDLLSISFINFNLNQNQLTLIQNSSTYLFDINSHNLSILNLSIYNSDYFNYFNFITISNIWVENALFLNSKKLQIPLSLDCVDTFNLNSQLFYIQGFNLIELKKITIQYYNSIDSSFIQIFSNVLKTMKDQEIIIIQDLRFFGNILLKINLRNIFSLITIYSEKNQLIKMNNVQFEDNLFHSYIDDSSQNTASLIFIKSQQSSVMISNLFCQSNLLTNSTSSFILINSKILNISNFQMFNHNLLNMIRLQSLFEFEFKHNLTQDQRNQLLSRILKIQNKGGVLSLTVEYCQMIYGKLSQILSLNGILLNIYTQGKGVIKLQDLEFISIESFDLQNSDNDGCITISSLNSLLQLELTNIRFDDILNKFASPILYIIPSQNTNQITIRNVIVFNCFSLTNILMKSQFSLMNIKNNKVVIEGIKIILNKNNFLQYLQKFNSLASIDIQKVLNDNGIIFLQGCMISIKEIMYEGVLLSSFLKITDAFKIEIEKVCIQQIQMILKANIIHVGHSSQNQYRVKIQNMIFSNISQFDVEELSNLQNIYNKIEFQNQNCNIIKEIKIQTIKLDNIRFDIFFEQLTQDSNQQGAIIYFQSQSNLNKIFLTQISVTNVKSETFLNAILYFDLSSFQSFQLIEFQCLWNKVNSYGCILVKSNQKSEQVIKIRNCLFYGNIGGSGTGINTQNVKLLLDNSKLIQNYASAQGGGLNMELDYNGFVIKDCYIQLNYANEAGGVYLIGNSKLNQNNFVNSIISFNKANRQPFNLQELPDSLILSINQQDMPSIQKIIENKQINILHLDPYKIMEQGNVIQTKVLVIPSNQVIKNYLLFNPNDQSFQNYIEELSISFKNSLNEKLISFINSTCKVEEQIYQNDKLELSKIPQIIQFKIISGNFDLSELQFSFDPYMEGKNKKQIFITCDTNNSYQELYYSLEVAVLKCQLGEFYIQNSCQQCSQNQGYYSVTYNSTKCSIFDKNKFENITSNQIYLKVGYWRPNQYSDDVEHCFKYPNICKGGWFVGDQLCYLGSVGGLCEECDKYNIRGDGYYFKNQYNLQCHLCKELTNSILLFIIASFWSLISTLLTLSSIDKSNQLFTFCKLRQKFSNIIFKLNQDHGSILIKLFLNYLWIFSSIFSFNINFTFSFSFIDQTSNPSYFMANNLDCYLSQINDVELIYLRIITMFLLMLCLLILIYLGFKLLAFISKKQFDASIISITALYLYVSNYATLIKQFFSLLAKRQISNLDYIQGDVSLRFGTSNHFSWIVTFIIPGLCLIGWLLPFSLLLLLYVKRHQIESIKFRKHFCYLFNEYNNQNFFWEWVKLAQKTFVIIILTYFETNIFLKASLLGLCLLFYQLYAQEQQPFIIQNFNKLDVKTGQICSISVFLAVIKYISEQQDNYILSFILQLILVCLSIKLSYPFIKNLVKLYHKKYKKQILILLSKIVKIFKCTSWIDIYLRNQFLVWNQKEQRLKSNFYKLRQHLIYVSKLQLEQQRSLSSLFSSDSLPRYRQLNNDQHLLKLRQDIN